MAISVFIADDHAVVRDGLILLLKTQEDIHVVGSAEDGHQAIRQVRKTQPHIVLMDISMPKLNGIETTVRILMGCKRTNVIILSMHADPEHIHRALRAGAQGYLLKESAGQEVIEAIRVVHSGCRYFSQQVSDHLISDYASKRSKKKALTLLELLSLRELETLQLVVEGRSSGEISSLLCISRKTVETYRSRVMNKLGIHDVPGLVKFAIARGLTTIEQ